MIDFRFLFDVFQRLLGALPMTLALFLLSVSLGAVLALSLTWCRVSGIAALDRFARGYVFVFRGSPLLVQMFLIYYGLGQFPVVRQSFAWPVLRDSFSCAVISLALCTAAYTAEIFRGALAVRVRSGRWRRRRACGMSGAVLFQADHLPHRTPLRPPGLLDRTHPDGEIHLSRVGPHGDRNDQRRAKADCADLSHDGGVPLRGGLVPLHQLSGRTTSGVPGVSAVAPHAPPTRPRPRAPR